MKHVVIAAHPRENSFTMTMVQAYVDAARNEGHEVVVRDLYRMKFDPVLPASELPWSEDFYLDKIVTAEHHLLANANVYVFAYPFWFNSPPAILKGYLERVFSAGFAYQATPHGSDPLLGGRSMVSITCSGAPEHWVVETQGLEASRQVFDQHFSSVCGLNLLERLHFGSIVPGIRDDVVARHTTRVKEFVETQFGRKTLHNSTHRATS